jgi:hypothetical protein
MRTSQVTFADSPIFLKPVTGHLFAVHLEYSRSTSFDYSIGAWEADDRNNHSGNTGGEPVDKSEKPE